MAYLWCWVLAPLVLFTMARNILEAYALPAFAGIFALITARLAMERLPAGRRAASGCSAWSRRSPARRSSSSARSRIDGRAHLLLLAQPHDASVPLVYLFRRPFSGQFTRRARRSRCATATLRDALAGGDKPATLLVPDYEFDRLGLKDHPRWREVARHGGYVMLAPRPAAP